MSRVGRLFVHSDVACEIANLLTIAAPNFERSTHLVFDRNAEDCNMGKLVRVSPRVNDAKSSCLLEEFFV